jgi:hypothetical protein
MPHQNTFRAARKDPHHAPEVSKYQTFDRCAVVSHLDRAIALDGSRFRPAGVFDCRCKFIAASSTKSWHRAGFANFNSGRVAA